MLLLINDQCPCQRCNGLETGAWEDDPFQSGWELPSEKEMDKAWADYYAAQRADDDAWMAAVKAGAQADLKDAIEMQIIDELQEGRYLP
jgi:hypothetical protein